MVFWFVMLDRGDPLHGLFFDFGGGERGDVPPQKMSPMPTLPKKQTTYLLLRYNYVSSEALSQLRLLVAVIY